MRYLSSWVSWPYLLRSATFSLLDSGGRSANGKSQQAYALGKFGKTYPKNGWGKPLLIGVNALIGFMVAMGALGFIFGAVAGAV